MGTKKMTSRRLGELIGRSESYASLLRRGKRMPSTQVVLALVRVFDLDRADVLDALAEGPESFGRLVDRVAVTETPVHDP